MKATKSQALLFMGEVLFDNKILTKNDYLLHLEMSDATFKRYISEFRSYLANFHSGERLIYDRKKGQYRLDDEEKNMSIKF